MHFQLPPEYLHQLPEARSYIDQFVTNLGEDIIRNKQKPLVFIAGPYTQPYPVYNTRRSMAWYDVLADTKVIVPHCPHWTMFQDLVFPKPYETWLELDKQMVKRSDGILRLMGESSGADGEVNLARQLKIPIFNEERFEELFPWAIAWIQAHK